MPSLLFKIIVSLAFSTQHTQHFYWPRGRHASLQLNLCSVLVVRCSLYVYICLSLCICLCIYVWTTRMPPPLPMHTHTQRSLSLPYRHIISVGSYTVEEPATALRYWHIMLRIIMHSSWMIWRANSRMRWMSSSQWESSLVIGHSLAAILG